MNENLEAHLLAGAGAISGVARYYRPSASALAWGAIATGVIAYELKAPKGQLLSEGADRLLERHSILPRLLGAVVLAHVVNAYPKKYEKYDPISASLKWLKNL